MHVVFARMRNEQAVEFTEISINSSTLTIMNRSQFKSTYQQTLRQIDTFVSLFEKYGSNWVLDEITGTDIRIKITDSAGGDLTDTDDYSVTNYFLHSLFSQVDVYLQNQIITDGNNCYPYKAYLEALLSHGQDYFLSQAQSALFFKDNVTGNAGNGYKNRRNICKNSSEFEVCDKLKIDIAKNHRYLLNDMNISLCLTRALDTFALEYYPPGPVTSASGTVTTPPSKNPKVKILDASFFVRKKVLYPSIILAHQKLLSENHNARYPLIHSSVKYYTIPQGNQSFVEEDVFQSKIPRRMILALLPNSSFNGSYSSNPLWFDAGKLSNINVSVNNAPIPIRPININFDNNEFIVPYYMLYTASGVAGSDFGFLFGRQEFQSGGYCLFPFDLTPASATESMLEVEKSGSVRVELKFREALKVATTLLIYYERQGLLEIDAFRQVNVQ